MDELPKIENENVQQENSKNLCDDGLGSRWCFWRRHRQVIALLAFFGFFNVYSLRVNLSVAIVTMTSKKNVTLSNGTTVTVQDFDWDSPTQGLLLSAFFYGYLVTQIPGGWLAARIGAAKLYGVGISGTALLTLLTPVLARSSVYLVLALRILEGLLEGVTHPSINQLWSRWAPPLERSRLATFALSGNFVGTVVSMPLSGAIAENCGWEAVFYFCGTIGLLWYAIWYFLVCESPVQDLKISPSELKYIQESLGEDYSASQVNISYPWKDILTSTPVWAVNLAHFTENWGFYTLLTQLPTFMKQIFHIDVMRSGTLSAIPYLIMAIVLQLSGHVADYLKGRKIVSGSHLNKIYICGAFAVESLAMIAAGFCSGLTSVMVCLSLAVSMTAFSWAAICVNHLDMAPQYAGVLMGFSQTVATLPGVISPALTGLIVKDQTESQWRIVFFISSGICVVGAVIYGVFGSGERQPWASRPLQNQTNCAPKSVEPEKLEETEHHL